MTPVDRNVCLAKSFLSEELERASRINLPHDSAESDEEMFSCCICLAFMDNVLPGRTGSRYWSRLSSWCVQWQPRLTCNSNACLISRIVCTARKQGVLSIAYFTDESVLWDRNLVLQSNVFSDTFKYSRKSILSAGGTATICLFR